MNRDEYLMDGGVNGFVGFLTSVVNGTGYEFRHAYHTAKRPVQNLEFNSVHSAFQGYVWDGVGYHANKEIIDHHKEYLIAALDSEGDDELGVLVASLRILEWGGVYTGSVGWLADKASDGCLGECLRRARDILDGTDEEGLNEFENNEILRSDSGMTKIHSLASKRSIIYDDRVGAALTMFVKYYLSLHGVTILPDLLNFMRGPKDRNPSGNGIRFRIKKQGTITHYLI